MPADFITKRAHKKSRAGCKTCKTKKVKCDEGQPKCTFCEKRNLTCEYLPRSPRSENSPPETPAPYVSPYTESNPVDFSSTISTIIRSPSPMIPTQSGSLSQIDLKAMHFWSLFTAESIAPQSSAVSVLQLTVPQLAFENEYLLNVILGISSLHMQSLIPASKEEKQATALYRTNSFSGFRKALEVIDASKIHSWEAALITSILLTVLCARDYELAEGDLIILNWLTLYRGLASVVDIRGPNDVRISRVSLIFQRSLNNLKIPQMVPKCLAQMLETIPSSDPDFQHLVHYQTTLDVLGVLYSSLVQDGLSLALRTRVNAWCSLITKGFLVLAKEKRPRALILLAYYMVFVKTMTGAVWWVDGISNKDIESIFKMISPKWFPLLETPRLALEIEDAEGVRDLLLASINESYTPTSVENYKDSTRFFALSPFLEDTECYNLKDELGLIGL